MTRLTTDLIKDMENTVSEWNEDLRNISGLDLCGISDMVGKQIEGETERLSQYYTVGVVPITSGLGTIDTFSQSVAAICMSMGFNAFVTDNSDVNGFFEARCKDADIIFMADDDRYLAVNLLNGKVGDNNIGTAYAFVALLNNMAKKHNNESLKNRNVAVLGYGIIGQLMATAIEEIGGASIIYDKNQDKKSIALADGFGWIDNSNELINYSYVVDGTNEGSWLKSDMLHPDVYMAAPGIPLSLEAESQKTLKGRYVHDLLEIGTAAMIGLVL